MSDAALRASLRLPCSCFSDTFLPVLSLLRRFPRRFIWRFPLCEDSLVGRPAFSRVGGCTGLRFCIAPPDDTLRAPLCLPCSCFSDTFLPALSPLRRFPRRFIWRFPSVKILPPPARLFPVSEAAPACASALRPWTIPCAPCFAFPCSCFSSKFSPGAFPSAEIFPSVHLALPLCEDFLAARPAFSRVGGCTGLRFCIAPLDNTLRASLCLPCPYFSSKFPSK